MKYLTIEDVLDYQIGCTALSTGGGGVAPSLEEVREMVLKVLDDGHKLKFVDLHEIPDDDYVFSACGTGGGIQTPMKMKWVVSPRSRLTREPRYKIDRTARLRDQIMQADREWCPLNTWSQIPEADFQEKSEERLAQLVGRDSYSNVQFEVAPGFVSQLCTMARKDKPFVDATVVGHRAAPEISQNGLNLENVQCTPAVWTTIMGDLLVIERTLCFQRMEELVEGISTYSGGSIRGLHAVRGSDMKKSAFPGSESLAMKVGNGIREASSRGDDPIDAVLKSLGPIGFKLFEGEIFDFWQDEEYSFMTGTAKIRGTGPYAGHDLRIWFKNENHLSWLDGKPHVTSPDGINVIDAETGWGLANFWSAEWEAGRKVSVIDFEAEKRWETPMGLKLFGPQHFRSDIQHVPLRTIYKGFE
jgi:DUF917 family protein